MFNTPFCLRTIQIVTYTYRMQLPSCRHQLLPQIPISTPHFNSQHCPYAGRGAYTAVSVAPALEHALVCWHAPRMPALHACGLPAVLMECIAAYTQHVTLQIKVMAIPALAITPRHLKSWHIGKNRLRANRIIVHIPENL